MHSLLAKELRTGSRVKFMDGKLFIQASSSLKPGIALAAAQHGSSIGRSKSLLSSQSNESISMTFFEQMTAVLAVILYLIMPLP